MRFAFTLSLSLCAMAISLQLCRIPTRTDLFSPDRLAGVGTLRCRKPLSVRCSGDSSSPSSSVAVDSDFDAKVFRKNLTRSKNYNRKGFGHKEETLELMNREYTSEFFFIKSILKELFMISILASVWFPRKRIIQMFFFFGNVKNGKFSTEFNFSTRNLFIYFFLLSFSFFPAK